MKIALLMSGECRQMWLAAPSVYKNVIEPNDADVFLYLNKESLVPRVPIVEEEEIVNKVFSKNVKSIKFTDDYYKKELEELYENNCLKINKVYKKINRDKWDKHIALTTTDQYLKVKKCCETIVNYAANNNFEYDIIVRVRPDIGWFNKFNLLKQIALDTLYINYHLFENKFPYATDSLFYGSQDIMYNCCTEFLNQMYDALEIYDERIEKDLSLAQELILGRYLKNSGTKITGINRPALSRYYVDWTKSPNFPLVDKFCGKVISENNSVYFDRIGEEKIIIDETIK